MLEVLVIDILAVYYITKVLVFDEEHTTGPWPSKTLKVQRPHPGHSTSSEFVFESFHEHKVTLFDHVRRLFGAYKALDTVWFVNEDRIPVWECPVCLSFWVSVFVTSSLCLLIGSFIWWPFLLFAACGGSVVLHERGAVQQV